jgi:uncharacterized YigZ family protein
MPYVRTIAAGGQHETEIKKSRFICTLARVQNEGEARAILDRLRKQYWDANHNCYAHVIGERGEQQKASDDGEPSGTAGVPMLEVLRKREIVDVLAVVTRYFGGTLLGSGGLIRAYGGAVSEAIDAIGIVERRPFDLVTLHAPYDDAGRIENALRASPNPPADVAYADDVAFTVHLNPDEVAPFRAWLAEFTGGTVSADVTGSAFVEVRI